MIVLFNQELIKEIDKLRQQPQKVAQTTNTFTVTAGDPPVFYGSATGLTTSELKNK